MTALPLSYLDSGGPAADPIVRLAWGLGAVSVMVVALTALALALAVWRPRRHSGEAADLVAAPPPGAGLAWIYWGLALSVPVLAVCTVWTLVVLGQVLHPAQPPRLTIQITAHQWWWEARYPAAEAAKVFTTANEIHIPVGEPVRIELSSPDVIHSFWAPKLAGKMDLIPGVTNVAWIQAAHPGRYRGQCAEFCGLEHARMAFEVVAQSPADFAAWRAAQLAPPAPPTGLALAGARVFEARCGACHAVAGTPAGGIAGPDLSHLARRATLAAGALPNTPDDLAAWIADPQAIKPGARMPAVPMSVAQRAAVVAYLRSLT